MSELEVPVSGDEVEDDGQKIFQERHQEGLNPDAITLDPGTEHPVLFGKNVAERLNRFTNVTLPAILRDRPRPGQTVGRLNSVSPSQARIKASDFYGTLGPDYVQGTLGPVHIELSERAQAHVSNVIDIIDEHDPYLASRLARNPESFWLLPEFGKHFENTPIGEMATAAAVGSLADQIGYDPGNQYGTQQLDEMLGGTPLTARFLQDYDEQMPAWAKPMVSYILAGIPSKLRERNSELARQYLRANPDTFASEALTFDFIYWLLAQQKGAVHETRFAATPFGAISDRWLETPLRMVQGGISHLWGAISDPGDVNGRAKLTPGQNFAISIGIDPSEDHFSTVSGGFDAIGSFVYDPVNIAAGVGIGAKVATRAPIVGSRMASMGKLQRALGALTPVYGRSMVKESMEFGMRAPYVRFGYSLFAKSLDDFMESPRAVEVAGKIAEITAAGHAAGKGRQQIARDILNKFPNLRTRHKDDTAIGLLLAHENPEDVRVALRMLFQPTAENVEQVLSAARGKAAQAIADRDAIIDAHIKAGTIGAMDLDADELGSHHVYQILDDGTAVKVEPGQALDPDEFYAVLNDVVSHDELKTVLKQLKDRARTPDQQAQIKADRTRNVRFMTDKDGNTTVLMGRVEDPDIVIPPDMTQHIINSVIGDVMFPGDSGVYRGQYRTIQAAIASSNMPPADLLMTIGRNINDPADAGFATFVRHLEALGFDVDDAVENGRLRQVFEQVQTTRKIQDDLYKLEAEEAEWRRIATDKTRTREERGAARSKAEELKRGKQQKIKVQEPHYTGKRLKDIDRDIEEIVARGKRLRAEYEAKPTPITAARLRRAQERYDELAETRARIVAQVEKTVNVGGITQLKKDLGRARSALDKEFHQAIGWPVFRAVGVPLRTDDYSELRLLARELAESGLTEKDADEIFDILGKAIESGDIDLLDVMAVQTKILGEVDEPVIYVGRGEGFLTEAHRRVSHDGRVNVWTSEINPLFAGEGTVTAGKAGDDNGLLFSAAVGYGSSSPERARYIDDAGRVDVPNPLHIERVVVPKNRNHRRVYLDRINWKTKEVGKGKKKKKVRYRPVVEAIKQSAGARVGYADFMDVQLEQRLLDLPEDQAELVQQILREAELPGFGDALEALRRNDPDLELVEGWDMVTAELVAATRNVPDMEGRLLDAGVAPEIAREVSVMFVSRKLRHVRTQMDDPVAMASITDKSGRKINVRKETQPIETLVTLLGDEQAAMDNIDPLVAELMGNPYIRAAIGHEKLATFQRMMDDPDFISRMDDQDLIFYYRTIISEMTAHIPGMNRQKKINELTKNLLRNLDDEFGRPDAYAFARNTPSTPELRQAMRDEVIAWRSRSKSAAVKEAVRKSDDTVTGPTRFISGYQNGVDEIGLEWAKRNGFDTSGTVPKGGKRDGDKITEEAMLRLGLRESDSTAYPPRTMKNVDDADATIVFLPSRTKQPSVGTRNTVAYAATGKWPEKGAPPVIDQFTAVGKGFWVKTDGHRPVVVVDPDTIDHAGVIALRYFYDQHASGRTVNLAGPRAKMLTEQHKTVIEMLLEDMVVQRRTVVIPDGVERPRRSVYIGRQGKGESGTFGNPWDESGRLSKNLDPETRKWAEEAESSRRAAAEDARALDWDDVDADNPAMDADLLDAITFPVKHRWNQKADVELIQDSFTKLDELATKYSDTPILMPMPGTGHGGLSTKEFMDNLLEPLGELLRKHPNIKLVIPSPEVAAKMPRGRLALGEEGTATRVVAWLRNQGLESQVKMNGDIFDGSGVPVITTNLGGVHGAGIAKVAADKGLVEKGKGAFGPVTKGMRRHVDWKGRAEDVSWEVKYENYLRMRLEGDPEFRAEVEKLRGQALWCPLGKHQGACHGDIIKKVLDSSTPVVEPEHFTPPVVTARAKKGPVRPDADLDVETLPPIRHQDYDYVLPSRVSREAGDAKNYRVVPLSGQQYIEMAEPQNEAARRLLNRYGAVTTLLVQDPKKRKAIAEALGVDPIMLFGRGQMLPIPGDPETVLEAGDLRTMGRASSLGLADVGEQVDPGRLIREFDEAPVLGGGATVVDEATGKETLSLFDQIGTASAEAQAIENAEDVAATLQRAARIVAKRQGRNADEVLAEFDQMLTSGRVTVQQIFDAVGIAPQKADAAITDELIQAAAEHMRAGKSVSEFLSRYGDEIPERVRRLIQAGMFDMAPVPDPAPRLAGEVTSRGQRLRQLDGRLIVGDLVGDFTGTMPSSSLLPGLPRPSAPAGALGAGPARAGLPGGTSMPPQLGMGWTGNVLPVKRAAVETLLNDGDRLPQLDEGGVIIDVIRRLGVQGIEGANGRVAVDPEAVRTARKVRGGSQSTPLDLVSARKRVIEAEMQAKLAEKNANKPMYLIHELPREAGLFNRSTGHIADWVEERYQSGKKGATPTAMRWIRRVKAAKAPEPPEYIKLTTAGAEDLDQVLNAMGIGKGQRAAIVDQFLATKSNERWDFLNNLFSGQLPEMIPDPILRGKLFEFSQQAGNTKFGFTRTGRDMGLTRSRTREGYVVTRPLGPTQMAHSFPAPPKEFFTMLRRYQKGETLSDLARKGTGKVREAREARAEGLIRQLSEQGIDVTQDEADALAYAMISQGDVRKLRAVVDKGVDAVSTVTRWFQRGFSRVHLAGRPVSWMLRVVFMDEMIRGAISNMPSMFRNPGKYFADVAAARQIQSIAVRRTKLARLVATELATMLDTDDIGALARVADDVVGGGSARFLKDLGLEGWDDVNPNTLRRWIRNQVKDGLADPEYDTKALSPAVRRARRGLARAESGLSRYDLPTGFTWDELDEILQAGWRASILNEIQSAVSHVEWNPSMSKYQRKIFGTNWGKQVASLREDPLFALATERYAQALAGEAFDPAIANRAVHGAWWELMRDNIAAMAEHAGVEAADDVALARWYIEMLAREFVPNLLDPLFDMGDKAGTAQKVLRFLDDGTLEFTYNSVEYSTQHVRARPHGFVKTFQQMAESVHQRTPKSVRTPAAVAGGLDTRMLHPDLGTKNPIIAAANWVIHTFGEQATQTYNRRPAFLRMFKEEFERLTAVGMAEAPAREVARSRAAARVNDVYFNMKDVPHIVAELNKYIPFFSAFYEVNRAWLLRMPKYAGAGNWAYGTYKLQTRANRLLRGLISTGLLEVAEEEESVPFGLGGVRSLRLRLSPHLLSNQPLARGVSGVAHSAMLAGYGRADSKIPPWPKFTILPILAALTPGVSYKDLIETYDRAVENGEDFSISIAVGNPLDPTSKGLGSAVSMTVGAGPLPGAALAYTMDAMPWMVTNSFERIPEGMGIREFAQTMETSTQELFANNRLALEKAIGVEQYNMVMRGTLDPDVLDLPVDFAWEIPKSSLMADVMTEFFFPFGRPGEPAAYIGESMMPSWSKFVLRGLALANAAGEDVPYEITDSGRVLFTGGGPVEVIANFMLPPETRFHTASQVLRAMHYRHSRDAKLGAGSVLEEMLARSARMAEITRDPDVQVDEDGRPISGGPKEAEWHEHNQFIEEQTDLFIYNATMDAAGITLMRGAAGLFGPSNPSIEYEELRQAGAYYDTRDFVRHGEIQGMDVTNMNLEAMFSGDRDKVDEELATFYNLLEAWLEDPTSDGAAKDALREHFPELQFFIRGTSYWAEGGPPPSIRAYDERSIAIREGKIKPYEPEVEMIQTLRDQSQASFEVALAEKMGTTDPVQQAIAIIENQDDFRALLDDLEYANNVITVIDEQSGKKWQTFADRGEQFYPSLHLNRQKMLRNQRDALDEIEDMAANPLDATATTAEIRERQEQITRVRGFLREYRDNVAFEREFVDNPREWILGQYYSEYADPMFKKQGELYDSLADAHTREEKDAIWNQVRELENEFFSRTPAIVTPDGRTVTMPSLTTRTRSAREPERQQAWDIKQLQKPTGWLSEAVIAQLVQSYPQLAEFYPTDPASMEVYTAWAGEVAALRAREDRGEISEYDMQNLKDQVDEQFEQWFIERGRENELYWMEATPARRMDLAGITAEIPFFKATVEQIEMIRRAADEADVSRFGRAAEAYYDDLYNQHKALFDTDPAYQEGILWLSDLLDQPYDHRSFWREIMLGMYWE